MLAHQEMYATKHTQAHKITHAQFNIYIDQCGRDVLKLRSLARPTSYNPGLLVLVSHTSTSVAETYLNFDRLRDLLHTIPIS